MKLSMDPHQVVPDKTYPNLGIFSFARGVFGKQPIDVTRTSATTLYRVKADQFIYSRLFAFEGAYTVVPDEFDGYFVSNEFPTFDLNPDAVLSGYLRWLFTCPWVWAELAVGSTGMGDRRQRIHPEQIANYLAPIPPLEEQRRIVARLDQVARLMDARKAAIADMETEAEAMLRAAFDRVIDGAPLRPIADVAPLVRRPVPVKLEGSYPELGVRSFGRGTFHKPPLSGAEVGTKKLFFIRPGDLVFNIVFAWEGAVAVAAENDEGRVGSHRFLTCVPHMGSATAEFLRFYFLTPQGLAKLGEASPGGAGRNRTLGLKALESIRVPTPSLDKQLWFDSLQAKVRDMRAVREQASRDAAALIPALLHEVFGDKGVS